MHISEGVLAWPVLAAGWGITIAGTAWGLKKIELEQIPAVAILAAVFFVASLIHIPIGITSVHLVLNGLLGAILGWAAFPAILVALSLQALLFSFGGLTVLGINTACMALPAVIFGLCLRPFIACGGKKMALAAFGTGFFAILAAGALNAASLTLSDQGFWAVARLVLLAHLPVAVAEGFITAFAVSFVNRVQPEILNNPISRGSTGPKIA